MAWNQQHKNGRLTLVQEYRIVAGRRRIIACPAATDATKNQNRLRTSNHASEDTYQYPTKAD